MWEKRALTYLVICILAIQISFTKQEQQFSWQGSDSIGANSDPNGFRPVTEESLDDSIHLNGGGSKSNTPRLEPPVAEAIIDNILVSNRQGRNLEGYDEIYADPNVKNALILGNDTLARSFIRDKLCALSLMNCDETEERRPFYSPHREIQPQEVIYVQPVTIKPVGRPLPSIPLRKPNNGYYGSKPPTLESAFSGSPSFGPPHHSPSFTGPQSFPGHSPPSFSGPYPGYKKPNTIHPSKLVYDAPFPGDIEYEDSFIDKKQSIAHGGSNVQHVHHHYHHNNGDVNAVPISSPGPIGNPGFNNYGYGNGGHSSNDFEEYKKNFKIKTSPSNSFTGVSSNNNNNYADRYASYEKPPRDADFSISNNAQGVHTPKQLGSFNSLGNSNRFPSYNKFGSNNNYISNNEFGSFDNGLSSSSHPDCVCVPYDRCATLDQVGRKDDLYLAIDPRNLDKKIEADTDQVVITDGNGTMSIVRVSKTTNETVTEKEGFSEDRSSNTSENKRSKRDTEEVNRENQQESEAQSRQFGRPPVCGPQHVCCPRNQHFQGSQHHRGQCGVRYSQGIAGRIKTPAHIDGDSEFGEYPWQVAILKKETGEKESVYVCGGSLISPRHIATAAHCIKTHSGRDLRARLGEWDVNHDVEFFPYIERNIISVIVHPEFYAGTLYNDIAILTLDYEVDFEKNPHINPACLPDKFDDFTNSRCWTTGWGKDAFGDFGKYQNILKEVDVPVISNNVCEHQMRRTRLGPSFNLHPGFVCAGGEEGKDACKGDGGGPMVCERNGRWKLAGIVSWGIGCGQAGVPGVYTRVNYYLDWINQIIGN